MSFNVAFSTIANIEGGLSNDPFDSGGRTKYGITEGVARDHGYVGDMADLTIEEARVIAKEQFWDVLRLDAIDAISEDVAEELFEAGYHLGVARAGGFLQICLNAFNNGGVYYPDLVVDGVVGPRTVNTLRRFLNLRGSQGEVVLMRALNALQGAAYVDLSQKRQKDEKFVYGWILNRVRI